MSGAEAASAAAQVMKNNTRREQWHNQEIESDRVPRDRTNPEILFHRVSLGFQRYFSRVVLHFHAKTSNTFDRFMLAERFAFSALMTLTSSVIFLMSFTFATLAGSILILIYSIRALVNCGRRMRMFVKNTMGE